jgi:hypothetical protein
MHGKSSCAAITASRTSRRFSPDPITVSNDSTLHGG